MADAHTKPNHEYHLVDPSPWPILGAIGAFMMALGAIMWMKGIAVFGVKPGSYIFGAGIILVLYVMASWWTRRHQGGRISRATTRRSCRSAFATA